SPGVGGRARYARSGYPMEVNEVTERGGTQRDRGFELEHESHVGAVRRRFATLAAMSELDDNRAGDAALIATELATNVVKHAGHGGALLGCVAAGDARGVSIAAWDRGPG